MLRAVRKLIASLGAPAAAAVDPAHDERLAATALLLHIAAVDGTVSDDERSLLRTVVKDRFDLDDDAVGPLLDRAGIADRDAVDLYGFTSVLKEKLDADGRARIIEMMWEMVFADGTLSEFEDNLVWRVAELLGVSSRDRVEMKQRARARATGR